MLKYSGSSLFLPHLFVPHSYAYFDKVLFFLNDFDSTFQPLPPTGGAEATMEDCHLFPSSCWAGRSSSGLLFVFV